MVLCPYLSLLSFKKGCTVCHLNHFTAVEQANKQFVISSTCFSFGSHQQHEIVMCIYMFDIAPDRALIFLVCIKCKMQT
jgi:hypothetical protein